VEDHEIVELYLARDETAIRETAEKYGSKLRAIAQHILRDREAAEECENDTYWEMWKRIPPHEPRDHLFAFAGRIARNIALNQCRKNSRQKRYAAYCELTREMKECIPASGGAGRDHRKETVYIQMQKSRSVSCRAVLWYNQV